MASRASLERGPKRREKIFTRITACYNIKRMKTLTIAFAALSIFALASCSKEDPAQKPSSEIVKEYTKTISTAQDKADAAGESLEKRDQEMINAIKELDK